MINLSEEVSLNSLNLIFEPFSLVLERAFSITDSFTGIWETSKGLDLKNKEKLFKEKESVNSQKEFKILKKERIELILKNEPEFLEFFKNILFCPLALYMKGSIGFKNKFTLAIVGTRKSICSRETAFKFAQD